MVMSFHSRALLLWMLSSLFSNVFGWHVGKGGYMEVLKSITNMFTGPLLLHLVNLRHLKLQNMGFIDFSIILL